MRRLATIALLFIALAGTEAAAGSLVLSDVQVRVLDGAHYVVRLQSSGPQPFDVVPQSDPTKFAVRLHGTHLDATAPPAAPFGAIRLRGERVGNVRVEVDLADRSWHAKAAQGRSPNVVDIRVAR